MMILFDTFSNVYILDSAASVSYGEDTMSSIRSEIDPEIKGPVICITVWIAMMVFISDGLQGSFGAYIYTYAIKSGNGITHDDAAYLNSLFWVCEKQ